MKILVLNCGSSTVKYNVYTDNMQNIYSGKIEKIGSEDAFFYCKTSQTELKQIINIPDHKTALEIIFNNLDEETKNDICCIGHRVVHGGEKFNQPVIVNEEVKNEIKKCFDLAPLHNPHNLKGILEAEKIFKKAINIAVFDTAFHQTIPQYAYIYGLPYQFYKKYYIRKYGFHGISHQYVMEKASELLNISLKEIKLITCHLGNGCSITAIKQGKSIDTSMGFTPLEGLVMGTRSGDIDPSIVTYLMIKEGLNINEINTLLNNRSGLYGISGISNDLRKILEEFQKNDRAKLALEIFCYRIKKYIGSYISVLNKPHGIIFTAGIGENSSIVREMCCSDLENLGVEIDNKLNKEVKSGLISTSKSDIKILVIPTNEELMIARQCLKILKNQKIS